MNENNVNVNVENEDIKSPVYSSKFLMNKELFYDFSSVSYNKPRKIFLIVFCIATYLIGINLLVGNYDIVVGFGPFICFLTALIYFKTKRSIKIGYERMVVSQGKEITLIYELFDDKIVSHNDELKREYSYHQITKFFETKSFILLHLKHNMYVTIEKNSLDANVGEFMAFLTSKCTFVKKKKFINCANDKKWSLVLLIALVVVSVIGAVLGSVLKINNLIF